MSRNPNTPVVQLLESVQQHGTVLFIQDISPNLDDKVRTNANKHPVKGGVMQLAESESVSDLRNSFRLTVRHNMRRIQELPMPQATQGALLSIRGQYPLTKGLLMESSFELSCHVSPYPYVRVFGNSNCSEVSFHVQNGMILKFQYEV